MEKETQLEEELKYLPLTETNAIAVVEDYGKVIATARTVEGIKKAIIDEYCCEDVKILKSEYNKRSHSVELEVNLIEKDSSEEDIVKVELFLVAIYS